MNQVSSQLGPSWAQTGPCLFFNFPKTHFGPEEQSRVVRFRLGVDLARQPASLSSPSRLLQAPQEIETDNTPACDPKQCQTPGSACTSSIHLYPPARMLSSLLLFTSIHLAVCFADVHLNIHFTTIVEFGVMRGSQRKSDHQSQHIDFNERLPVVTHT